MITVIIPSYNCEKFIEQTLVSVVRQTLPDEIEILVIDDCSTDATKERVEAFIEKISGEKREYKRTICYQRNPKNLGVAETRNVGIRQAKGEYLAFLDGDDWWREDKLERQLDLIRRKKCVLVYTGRELMHPDGSFTGKVVRVPEFTTYQALLHTNCIPCSSVLIKTEAAREFYMNHDELHEDYILWLNVLKKYGKAYGINEPMLKSRLSPGGKSRNKLKSAKMHYGVYQYMGIPTWKAVLLFCSYAIHGARKYLLGK